jgi:phosphonate dehydrogenase
MPHKVVVSSWAHPEALDPLAEAGFVVDANPDPEPWSEQVLRGRVVDADALLAFMPDRIGADFLDACPRLRIVAGALKGWDNFDEEAFTARGVWLTIVPDLLTIPTAELAIGLLLGLGRHVLAGDAHVRSGNFQGWRPALYGRGLSGSTVGILGMGAVGRAIAERLRGFGPRRIVYWDQSRLAPELERKLQVDAGAFDEILRSSDFVLLALPLTASTRHVVDRSALARMKRDALLINPARGSLVDEAAVAEALESGALGGYAADAFEMEDWARADRPTAVHPGLLARRSRTLFTPHLGSAVDDVRREIVRHAALSIVDCLQQRLPPRGAVNHVAGAAC